MRGLKKNTEVVRRWRKLNPLRSAYLDLKSNAKRRGKKFEITFEYFKRFAKRCKVFNRRGILKDSYHIDRKKEDAGYVIGNLQMITNSENVKKYLMSKKYVTVIEKAINCGF